MISLKKYLDSAPPGSGSSMPQPDGITSAALAAYGSALVAMGNCSLEACPGLGNDLKQHLDDLNQNLAQQHRAHETLATSNGKVQETVAGLGKERRQGTTSRKATK